jgi:alanine racemase
LGFRRYRARPLRIFPEIELMLFHKDNSAAADLEDGLAIAGPPEGETGSVLTVDCGAIVRNWKKLSNHAAPAECAAVVKADAYGCGIEPVGRALREAGCRTFFVAHIAEARQLRDVLSDADIYVTNGIPPGEAHVFAELNAQPVIGNLAELAEWDAFRANAKWDGGAALHFDTGMNRLGLDINEAAAIAERIKLQNHGISLVMSHFAASDEPDHPFNPHQVQALRDIRQLFPHIPASLANSSGIFLGASAHFDIVRPGIALYGGNPTPWTDNPMEPTVELKARIVQTRTIENGATVGYNTTWTARRQTRVAIAATGYADGYPRPAGASDTFTGGFAMVGGQRCPVIGRVSMDLLAIDITDVPELTDGTRRGDAVTLLGDGITIDELAAWGRTISWDVLTRLGRRCHRVWKN